MQDLPSFEEDEQNAIQSSLKWTALIEISKSKIKFPFVTPNNLEQICDKEKNDKRRFTV
jgi:hypothetical protein